MQLLVMLTFIFHGFKACRIKLKVKVMDKKYVYFHLYVYTYVKSRLILLGVAN